MEKSTFESKVKASIGAIRPAEQRVARFFLENREETLIGSASVIAKNVGTSDATVIRTVKALGFSGMDEMRRAIIREMRAHLSPSNRLAQTLTEVGSELISALDVTLDIHQKALHQLRDDIQSHDFEAAVAHIGAAKRTFIFGIGPSSAMANYFTLQLERFGIEARSITQTGLLLADQIRPLRKGDLLMIFAYGRVYPELASMLDHAKTLGLSTILFSDTLGAKLRDQVTLSLSVPRGRTDMLSMHTTTLALIEALLVGVAMTRPTRTLASLKLLNELRANVAGKRMDLPAS